MSRSGILRGIFRPALALSVFLLGALSAGCSFPIRPLEMRRTPTPGSDQKPSLSVVDAMATSASSATSTATWIAFGNAPGETATPLNTEEPTLTAWPNNTPTFGPSPTASRTPTLTPAPTLTRLPTLTWWPTRTKTITLTPTPPAPLNDIVAPGLLSKVVSPIHVELYAISGDDGLVHIDLIGEDGRVITQTQLSYYGGGHYVYAVPQISFKIEAESELARLQVHSEDRFGRTIALSSVDVVLLAEGRADINPPAIVQDPYLIRSPQPGKTISGGLLVLDGLAHPVNESPLIVELISEGAQVIASQTLDVSHPSGDTGYTPFHLELAYHVSAATPVRLVIRQEGSRIPGTVFLSSQEIILGP